MGTWGTGIFEDDTALDAMEQAMQTSASDYMTQILPYCEQDYLEFSEAHQVMIAGVILDHVLNGTPYETNDEAFENWLEQQAAPDNAGQFTDFKPLIVRGLKLMTSGQSELGELWQENEVDYPTWLGNVEAMIARLEQA
ncbi:MAG: DUF4259 domain-containing protein [Moraxellaceae bacterium]|nr:MAG: DUF4259 domain-containing protein [Moraxellaceae bacterium]